MVQYERSIRESDQFKISGFRYSRVGFLHGIMGSSSIGCKVLFGLGLVTLGKSWYAQGCGCVPQGVRHAADGKE